MATYQLDLLAPDDPRHQGLFERLGRTTVDESTGSRIAALMLTAQNVHDALGQVTQLTAGYSALLVSVHLLNQGASFSLDMPIATRRLPYAVRALHAKCVPVRQKWQKGHDYVLHAETTPKVLLVSVTHQASTTADLILESPGTIPQLVTFSPGWITLVCEVLRPGQVVRASKLTKNMRVTICVAELGAVDPDVPDPPGT